jgi:hypothetical protein
MNTIPITYGEFYDVPRMIRFPLGGQWYFLRSYFDEAKDDYAEFYDVYLLPFHSEDEFKSNPKYWMELNKAVHLGRIAVGAVGLDETRRRSIDAEAFARWLTARTKENGGQ